MVEKPERVLYHFGTNNITPHTLTKSVYSNSDTIILTERYTTPNQIIYNPGKYVVKTYQIDASVSHPGLYPSDSLIAYWPRHSSSFVFELPADKRLNLHERMEIVSLSASNAFLRGYVYQVWDSLGTMGWWPCDTTFNVLTSSGARPKTVMEYSILTKNKAVGINEKSGDELSVFIFPNPARKMQTLLIESDKPNECAIELYDLRGRLLHTVYKGKIKTGKMSVAHDVEKLPNSMYIYKIKVGEKVTSKKFIKE